MPNPNIGVADRYVRLAGGLLLMGSALTQRRSTIAKQLLLAVGAMKVTEGIMGWCPVMHLAGVTEIPNTESNPGQRDNSHSHSEHSHAEHNQSSHRGEGTHGPSQLAKSDTPMTAYDATFRTAPQRGHSDTHREEEATDAVGTSFQSFEHKPSEGGDRMM